MRLIDADCLKRAFCGDCLYHVTDTNQCLYCHNERAILEINKQPTIDHVKHGHWIPKETMVRSIFAKNYVCSTCGVENFQFNFCPDCGTKMDEKGD